MALMKQRFFYVATFSLILMAVFGLVACNKKAPGLTTAGASNEPAWVAKCAAAFPDAGKNAFYGCGSMPVVENRELQRVSAEARARKDLALKIDAYLADFLKEFLADAAIRDKMGVVTELKKEEFISTLTREVTTDALSGARVVRHWRSPKDGTLFALDQVSFDIVAVNLEKQMRRRAGEINLDPREAVKLLDLRVVRKRWK
jgi:hypothetical protein